MAMSRLSRRRWLAFVAGLGAGLTFACGQQPTPAAQSTSPPATAQIQSAPAAGKRAELITATQLALPPSLFWGVPNGWSNLSKIDALTGDWLVMPDADGTLIPRLAREVPTLANGGARFEGEGPTRRLRVTYRLRDGLVWQDGTPLTSADVAFAFELQRTPEFPLIDRSLVARSTRSRPPIPSPPNLSSSPAHSIQTSPELASHTRSTSGAASRRPNCSRASTPPGPSTPGRTG